LVDAWIEKFRNVPTSWVSDSLGRSVGTYGLNSYHGDLSLMMVGRAYTIRIRPGDNLMIHKALQLVEKGDVIVIDGGGDVCQSLIGGNILTTAVFKGVAGFVIDGAVRDLVDLAKGALPVWARGHTHRGPSKDGPGEINVPISCGGMIVHPGDLVIGDADGVLAVRPGELEALWPIVEKQREKEAKLAKSNAIGDVDPERFDSILRAKGCPV
jgi:regulator of RNase E activity RraA